MLKIEMREQLQISENFTEKHQVKIKIKIFYFLPPGNIKMDAVTVTMFFSFFFFSITQHVDISFFLVETKEYNESF